MVLAPVFSDACLEHVGIGEKRPSQGKPCEGPDYPRVWFVEIEGVRPLPSATAQEPIPLRLAFRAKAHICMWAKPGLRDGFTLMFFIWAVLGVVLMVKGVGGC